MSQQEGEDVQDGEDVGDTMEATGMQPETPTLPETTKEPETTTEPESQLPSSPGSLHLGSDGDAPAPALAAAFYTPATSAALAEQAAALSQRQSGSGSASSSNLSSRKLAAARLIGSRSKRPPAARSRDGSRIVLVDVENVGGAVVTLEQYTGGHFTPEVPSKDTFWPCTFNLSKVIMGAGMMAIPRAFLLLGLLPGLGILTLIAGLTFFTLGSLISASSSTGMEAGTSYGALVRRTVGPSADKALQVSVLATCFVMIIVFVVVLGDILLGSAPDYSGLLPELLGRSPEGCWWLGRPLVLGLLSLLVLLPLSSMRSMERLAVVNIIGVASNGVFAGLLLALAASAAANGALQPPPLLPDLPALGSSPLMVAMALASIVPVLLNCDVCHQSLHPLMPLLQPYSVRRMQRVVATALAICNVLYLAVSICAGLVYGEALDADVLTNVSTTAMGPLIGPIAATVMADTVRVGYLMSLVGSYVLLCYPLRQCVGDLLLSGQGAVQHHWSLLTVSIVGSAYAIACYLPSIWAALSLVGATASTVQAFIVPALVVLAVERAATKKAAAAARQLRSGAVSSSSSSSAAALSGRHRPSALQAPLLGPARPEEERLLSHRYAAGSSSHHGLQAEGAAQAEAVEQTCGAVLGRLLRQATAVFVLLLGIALFVNGVADNLWGYIHPRSEGVGVLAGQRHVVDVWRHLLRPPL